MSIQVKNISKQFKDFTALQDANLDIHSGELIALVGPSGSGKTTLLRIIAGLEFADSGTVLFDGENTQDKSLKERNVGFVFQHYALFKHMTVFENIAFGLRVRPRDRRPSNQAIATKVTDLLKLVHLDKMHDRYPSQLSGGQRQRVALARSLAVEPKVLLLDEPFGALDSKVRKELRRWMRRLHDELDVTSIFVTHDQGEAMEVADRVVVMSQGRVEQVGTPAQVYHEPVNGFVYDFLGNYNEFEGWKGEDGIAHITEYEITSDMTTITQHPAAKQRWLSKKPVISSVLQTLMPRYFPEDSNPSSPRRRVTRDIRAEGKAITIFARPHEMEVTKTLDEKEYIKARVVHINPAGPLVKLELERENGSIIQAEIPKDDFMGLTLQKGELVYTRPKETRIFE